MHACSSSILQMQRQQNGKQEKSQPVTGRTEQSACSAAAVDTQACTQVSVKAVKSSYRVSSKSNQSTNVQAAPKPLKVVSKTGMVQHSQTIQKVTTGITCVSMKQQGAAVQVATRCSICMLESVRQQRRKEIRAIRSHGAMEDICEHTLMIFTVPQDRKDRYRE
jgi:hypothetical protein